MASLFERIAALNSQGPYRAKRVTAEEALKGGRHPVLENPRPNPVLGTPLFGALQFRAAASASAGDALALDAEVAESWARAEEIVFGMGCFWGAERLFWGVDGVLGTSVGYAGGWTKNPTYREVCTGRTGHAEVVRVVFDPERVSVEQLLKIAFENHDPTLGDRQGNDVGTQYRSAVYASSEEQLGQVRRALGAWSQRFIDAGLGELTSEIGLLADTHAGNSAGVGAGDAGESAGGFPGDAPADAGGDAGDAGEIAGGDVVGDGHYYLAEDEHQQYLHKHPGGYCNHGPNGVECPTGVL